MLTATQRAERQKVAPGGMILKQGEPVEHFFMIVSGEVEIVAKNEQRKEMPLARLGQGQFFGEVELTQGGHSIAQVHGAGDGARHQPGRDRAGGFADDRGCPIDPIERQPA